MALHNGVQRYPGVPCGASFIELYMYVKHLSSSHRFLLLAVLHAAQHALHLAESPGERQKELGHPVDVGDVAVALVVLARLALGFHTIHYFPV